MRLISLALLAFGFVLILCGVVLAFSHLQPTSSLYDFNGDGIVDWRDVDVNGDGTVDIYDVSLIASCINSTKGDEKYVTRYDLNQDGKIDQTDLNLIRPYYGFPLSIFEVLFNPTEITGQLFIIGLALAVLGVCIIVVKGGRKI